jgi:hypothetical protein
MCIGWEKGWILSFHFCMFGFILQPRRRDTRFKPLGSWQHQ